jgi:hypothetical protein
MVFCTSWIPGKRIAEVRNEKTRNGAEHFRRKLLTVSPILKPAPGLVQNKYYLKSQPRTQMKEKNMLLIRKANRSQGALISLCTLLCLFLFSSLGYAKDKVQKSPLILHPYHPALSWTNSIMKGMRDALSQSEESIIGGKLVGAFVQGKLAGKLAMRVLRGEDREKIPVIRREAANKFMFDYHELSRFGLTVRDVPDGSEVINSPPSFYVVNKMYIWGGIVSLLIFSCIIVLLGINIVLKRRAKEALRESENRFWCLWSTCLQPSSSRINRGISCLPTGTSKRSSVGRNLLGKPPKSCCRAGWPSR